jgi:DUF1680 family protein
MRGVPLAPGAVQFSSPGLASRYADTDPDSLFTTLEHPSDRQPPDDAGQPGIWLQSACALGRDDARLRQAQDMVATRLMNSQDRDGYLAAGTKTARWSAAQISAYRENMLGLLAYYAITHSPAAIYMSMQAGDLILTTFPNSTNAPAADGLLLPMVQLAHWTGNPTYLEWAKQQADGGTTDGPGLCALYRDTGQASYLHAANTLWQMELSAERPDPALATALWSITGATNYVPYFQTAAAPWSSPLEPGSSAYGSIPGGLVVNVFANSRATLGPVHVTQRLSSLSTKPRLATFTLNTPHPVILTLMLPAPPPAGLRHLISFTLNGKTQRAAPAGEWLTLNRRWKTGDQISLLAAPTPYPPQNASKN